MPRTDHVPAMVAPHLIETEKLPDVALASTVPARSYSKIDPTSNMPGGTSGGVQIGVGAAVLLICSGVSRVAVRNRPWRFVQPPEIGSTSYGIGELLCPSLTSALYVCRK